MPSEDFTWAKDPTESGGPSPWQETRIDTSVPSIARVYDYSLGGKDNFAVDRAACRAFLDAMGEAHHLPEDNRAWLARATRYLVAEAGIRQIIELGSGLPTANNIHEVAQAIAPETTVVYVDNDPIVLAHGRAILAANDRTTVITADVTDPARIFGHPDLRELIDPERPYAVYLAGVLHHMEDGYDQRAAARVRDHVGPGSYLLIGNFHDPGDPRAKTLERSLIEGGLGTGRFRSWEEQRQYFAGLELVPPGLCPVNDWRPDARTRTDSSVHHLYIGGIGVNNG